jgi:hypothetical protein
MSVVELYADDGAARPALSVVGTPADGRPHVAGDLPSLFRAAPMFRRALAGYDRYQVDSYVRWAEDELATADREREHLVTRHLSTQAALDEARELLSHSASGGEFLQVSRRIGSLLATAADEAESIRSRAQADLFAAAVEAQRTVDQAAAVVADAEARAEHLLLETAAEVEARTAEADRILADAGRTRSVAEAEAQARLEQVRQMEQLAVEQAEQIRQQANEDASAALLATRAEVVRMLSTGREERRRADAEAAAARELLEQAAATRCAALRAEIAALEQQQAGLRALDAVAEPVARPTGRPLEAHLRELLEKLRLRPRSLPVP